MAASKRVDGGVERGSEVIASDEPNASELPFDEAITQLESIVEQMESGNLPLETLLQRFEEGSKLLERCQAKLRQAEQKLLLLDPEAKTDPTAQPWDAAAIQNPRD